MHVSHTANPGARAMDVRWLNLVLLLARTPKSIGSVGGGSHIAAWLCTLSPPNCDGGARKARCAGGKRRGVPVIPAAMSAAPAQVLVIASSAQFTCWPGSEKLDLQEFFCA